MEQAPVPSAQTPLAGLEASVSFVVLTVNVSCAGGKVRGDSARNGRSVCDGLGTIAGRDAAATDKRGDHDSETEDPDEQRAGTHRGTGHLAGYLTSLTATEDAGQGGE